MDIDRGIYYSKCTGQYGSDFLSPVEWPAVDDHNQLAVFVGASGGEAPEVFMKKENFILIGQFLYETPTIYPERYEWNKNLRDKIGHDFIEAVMDEYLNRGLIVYIPLDGNDRCSYSLLASPSEPITMEWVPDHFSEILTSYRIQSIFVDEREIDACKYFSIFERDNSDSENNKAGF